ncbi:MAG TPA: hydroxyacylglutathione hydrolase, partial [Pirellulales bacterium]|nr:hydroxyacylglutathione hydrolase [Pirellulales bacterium]
DEKREFCQRHATRWNVTRHRIAQQIHQRVAAALADGSLSLVKGGIRDLQTAGSGIAVTVEDRDGQRRTIQGGLVINCTGPLASISAAKVPLLENLLRHGLVQADELDMGLVATADFAAIERGGNRSPFLFAMGSLLKGTLWETTAVPELRGQAFRVAQVLLNEFAAERQVQETWAAQPEVEVLEYCI